MYIVSTLFVATLLFAGCHHQQDVSVIARVGDAELTLEEATSHIDTSRGSSVRQLQEYVASWINTELLYQEAQRTGVASSKSVDLQLKDIRRQVVGQVFLEKHIFSSMDSLGDEELRKYYQVHASEFFIPEPMMKLNVIVFRNRTSASAFAEAVSRSVSWNTTVTHTLRDTSLSSGIVSSSQAIYYTQHSLFPPALWKVAMSLADNEISFPVKTSQGYCVLQTISRVKEGAPADYDNVKDEVRQRVSLEQRRLRYTNLLGTLRKQYNVDVFVPVDSTLDTNQIQTNE